MKLTRKEMARRSFLINELSRLSRGGWHEATRDYWETLEVELRRLNEKAGTVWAVSQPEALR